jgi:hypothetical protein
MLPVLLYTYYSDIGIYSLCIFSLSLSMLGVCDSVVD